MKIVSSDVSMASQYTAVERREVKESLSVWVGDSESNQPTVDTADISAMAQALQPQTTITPTDYPMDPINDAKLQLLRLLLERMFGAKLKLMDPADLMAAAEEATGDPAELAAQQQSGQPAPQPAGWGLVYDHYESRYESQQVQFAAMGTVRTADGQEIQFEAQLGMSREFYEEHHDQLRLGDAALTKDPLVLNFKGNAAELTNTRFQFDIDADGQVDQVSLARGNTAMLAVDRNDDGQVNDGGELFGPTTGDGWSELAKEDGDGNGWIDENDPIYSRLRLWSKNDQGQDVLTGLGQRGVGAIYLGHVDAPFRLDGAGQEMLGEVRSTGIFLSEAGTPGTVQQLDLAV